MTPKSIASLISEDCDISPSRLLHEYIQTHAFVRFDPFSKFCRNRGIVIESTELLDLLDGNRQYVFHEKADVRGPFWVPVLPEGYVNGSVDMDTTLGGTEFDDNTPPLGDFGDEEDIAGITGPADTDDGSLSMLPLDDIEDGQANNSLPNRMISHGTQGSI